MSQHGTCFKVMHFMSAYTMHVTPKKAWSARLHIPGMLDTTTRAAENATQEQTQLMASQFQHTQ